MMVFPTKALAQDQQRALRSLVAHDPALAACVRPAVLDGDTLFADRSAVRDSANILLVNPDIIHATLLPNHRAYARVLGQLHTVVVDECHVYSGVFGSHVALILRRLVRLSRSHGSNPRFIGGTATIGNALEHFQTLVPLMSTGRTAVLVGPDVEGSAMGRRRYFLWNPPLIYPSTAGVERTPSAVTHAVVSAAHDGLGDSHLRVGSLAVSREKLSKRGTLTRRDEAATRIAPACSVSSEFSVGADEVATANHSGLAAVSPVRVYRDWRSTVAAFAGKDVMQALWGASGTSASDHVAKDCALSFPAGSSDAAGATETQTIAAGTAHLAPPRWLRRWLERRQESSPRRRNAIVEAAAILAALVRRGVRTLAFARSRRGAELLLLLTYEALLAGAIPGGALLCAKVKSYRAGYLREQRRSIERALFSGELLAVVATNALELGVDIGCLDVTLLVGCPASAASGAQQAGRAGRSGRDATCIVVAGDSPIVRVASAVLEEYASTLPLAFHRTNTTWRARTCFSSVARRSRFS